MCFSRIITAICVFFLGEIAVASTAEIGEVSDVSSGRVGDNVVRYVKKFNSSCLEVQVINPDSHWKILSASNFCKFEGKSLDSDFADAGFEDISIMNDGLHMTLSITPLRPTGEERRACHIPIEGAVIKELKCADRSR